jgi:hypothetical protein
MRIHRLNEIEPISFGAANMFNAVRSMVRLVMRGYGDQQTKNVFEKKITRQRLIHLEEDFRELGRALAFLDPRETNSASRTFDQGNFFSYHGNGDEYLTAYETSEILSILLSGGRAQLNEIYADLGSRKCLLPEIDIFGKNFVSEDCFYQTLRERLNLYTNHIPKMQEFLSHLSPKDFAEAYRGLMSVSYVKSHQAGKLESTEIRSFCVVLDFIESLMSIYDVNNDMLLTENEVASATPRFSAFITKVSPLGDFLVEDIFLYLAFKGEKPAAEKWDSLTAFVLARNTIGIGETNKLNLIKLLGVLNNESK